MPGLPVGIRDSLGLLQLRRLLRDVGFCGASAATVVGAKSEAHLIENPAMYALIVDHDRLQRTAQGLLSVLFILNGSVEGWRLLDTLGDRAVALLLRLGFLRVIDNTYEATLSITAFGDRYYLSDKLFVSTADRGIRNLDPADGIVMPPHLSSVRTLRELPGVKGRMLDIGCGCGFLSIEASRSGSRLIGVDLNPRAISFSRANARFNASGAAFVHRDIFEYVAKGRRRFDYAVFNAPTLPSITGKHNEVGRTQSDELLRRIASLGGNFMHPGRSLLVHVLVEVPSGFDTTRAVIESWLKDLTGRFSVRELDIPQLEITPVQLARRRLHGRSLLVPFDSAPNDLFEVLDSKGISRLVPVVVDMCFW